MRRNNIYSDRELELLHSKAFDGFRLLFYIKSIATIMIMSFITLVFIGAMIGMIPAMYKTATWDFTTILICIIGMIVILTIMWCGISAGITTFKAIIKGPDFETLALIRDDVYINVTELIDDRLSAKKITSKLYCGRKYLYFIPTSENKVHNNRMYLFIRKDEIDSVDIEICKHGKSRPYAIIRCKDSGIEYRLDYSKKINNYVDEYNVNTHLKPLS